MCVVGKQETSNNNILDWSDVIEHTTNCAHIRRHSADFIRSSRLTTRRAAGSSEVCRLTTLDASTRTVRSNVALTTIYNSLCMTFPAGTSTLKQRWILVDHQRWILVGFESWMDVEKWRWINVTYQRWIFSIFYSNITSLVFSHSNIFHGREFITTLLTKRYEKGDMVFWQLYKKVG